MKIVSDVFIQAFKHDGETPVGYTTSFPCASIEFIIITGKCNQYVIKNLITKEKIYTNYLYITCGYKEFRILFKTYKILAVVHYDDLNNNCLINNIQFML